MYADFRARYEIAPSFQFNGNHILLYGTGRIVLGDNSYIGSYSTLQASDACMVSIGRGCHIASNVRIFSESVRPDSDFRFKPVPSKAGDVFVADACWIGANVVVNPNITIGENSVIGANSVVTCNIPANEIWGGVPARFIRKKAQQIPPH